MTAFTLDVAHATGPVPVVRARRWLFIAVRSALACVALLMLLLTTAQRAWPLVGHG
jgi:hypothetical protein